MANDAAKRRLRANASRLRHLRLGGLASAALHALIRHALRRSSLLYKLCFTLTCCSSFGAFAFLRSAAKPSYGQAGELLGAGEDLTAGACESVTDLFALLALCQLLSCFTDFAWLLLLLVPVKAGQWAWTNVLAPFIFEKSGVEQAKEDGRKGRKERDVRQKRRTTG
jgi:hypothetical protein